MATQASQATTQPSATVVKRKRKAPVSTAARLQPKTLLASTRDELRDIQVSVGSDLSPNVTFKGMQQLDQTKLYRAFIQAELLDVAEKRREALALDKRGNKSALLLVPPKL